MADFSPVALQVQAPDPSKTFNTLAQASQAMAHTGVFMLQQQKQAIELNALRAAGAYHAAGDYNGAANAMFSIDPLKGQQYLAGLKAQREYRDDTLARDAQFINSLSPDKQPEAYQNRMRQRLSEGIITPMEAAQYGKWNPQITPRILQGFVNSIDAGRNASATVEPQLRFNLGQHQNAIDYLPPQQTAPGNNLTMGNQTKSRVQTVNPQNQQVPQTPAAPSPQTPNRPAWNLTPPEAPLPNVPYPANPQVPGKDQTRVQTPQQLPERPLNTPQSVQEQQHYGTHLGELPKKIDDEAKSAVNANFILDNLENEAKKFRGGAWADTELKFKRYLQAIAKTQGIDMPELNQNIGSMEGFQKNSLLLASQLSGALSSQGGVQQLSMFSSALPKIDMSSQGFQEIAKQFRGTNDFTLAKQQFSQMYRKQNGSLDGFEATWNQNASPYAFMLNRMDPDKVKEFGANLAAQGPQGQAFFNQLVSQVEWAQKNGLMRK